MQTARGKRGSVVSRPSFLVLSDVYRQLVRWAFDRFYREFAWTYDAVAAAVSAGSWRGWTLQVRPFLSGRVLELGCGTGNLQRAIADTPAHTGSIGLDISAQMLRLTARRLAAAGHTPRLLRADARSLPIADGAFDTVVATFPSEYIAAESTLREARRVLPAGGRLIVVLGATLAGDGTYQRTVELAYRITLQRSPRDMPRRRPEQRSPAGMTDDRTLSRLAAGLARAGFSASERWVDAPGGMVYVVVAEALP